MTDTTYNGWRNYETWLVNLWIDNSQGDQEYWQEAAREELDDAISNDSDSVSDARDAAAVTLADMLQDWLDDAKPELPNGLFSDLINAALGAVDRYEIARHWVDDIDVYSAGWNMPGYTPDNPPALFTDPDAALDYVRDAAKEENDADTEHAEDTVHERRLAIDAWQADRNGEFGETIGRFHYFVSLV